MFEKIKESDSMGKKQNSAAEHLSKEEEQEFSRLLAPLLENENALRMKEYIQHGTITTHEHCVDVARCAFKLNRKLHLHADEKALVEAGYLHDYYLYDWHTHGDKLHGYHHPALAAENASRDFKISGKAAEAIRTHMWPLTLTRIPSSREAWLITLADKICSTRETLFERGGGNKNGENPN